jgi:hypothetical protein
MARPKRELSDCIYCRSTAPPKGREHVIPQSFGTFKNNWTLTCVCDGCNGYFARELEVAFARDTVEAYLRLEHGLKPPNAAFQLLNRRMQMTVVGSPFYQGAKTVLVPTVDGVSVAPFPKSQVAFCKDGDEDVWIDFEDLNPQTVAPFCGDANVKIKIVGHEQTPAERVIARLAELGINFVLQGRHESTLANENNKVVIEHEFDLDLTVLRTVAKVAFNYVAKTLGAGFARRSEFDSLRRFVRYGEAPTWQVVTLAERRALGTDRGCTGERPEITRGHLFDPFSHEIGELPFVAD